jgi:hypothetical protein
MFRKRIQETALSVRCPGILSVLTHLEQAETLYGQGANEKQDQYFTDAVYRANHAFEGILREAYGLFTKRDASGSSIAAIEAQLVKKGVFRSRVMELFKNYRQSWRNPSTHDHTLFFDRVESFLAVASVSSFANVLAEQMVEKISFDSTETEIKESGTIRQIDSPESGRFSTMERICMFLTGILEQKASEISFARQSESEVIGLIQAFLEIAKDVKGVKREPQIGRFKTPVLPDISFELEGKLFILEIKQGAFGKSGRPWIERMTKYLAESAISNAVLVVVEQRPYDYRIMDRIVDDRKVQVGVVANRQSLES